MLPFGAAEEGYYVIDPGASLDRMDELRRAGPIKAALITHLHSDHVTAAKDFETYTPMVDAGGVEDARLRVALTFGAAAPEGITAKLLPEPTVSSIILSNVTVKSLLGLLYKRGEVEAVAKEGLNGGWHKN
jgi:glyoxylase-like metal-dependent hydrolase (beta-lactamase superfamily II)